LPRPKAGFLPPLLLALFTLVSRLLFHGPPYFADGPAHIRVILAKIYIIQPPGYWLFNRLGGLFPDPAAGISVWWPNLSELQGTRTILQDPAEREP
jgi:hypothetical protein